MKIVHIITRLYKGGAEENTLQSCLHQSRSGHDVTLIYGPDNLSRDAYQDYEKHIRFYPVNHLRHPIDLAEDVRGVFELASELGKLKPDVVHTHTSKAGIIGRIAAKCAGVARIVHGVHILPFSNAGAVSSFVYLAVEHAASLFTDLFVHVSEGTKRAYREAGIGRDKPHEVVHSGMEIGKFMHQAPPENWMEILNLPPGANKPKIILMLAAMEPRKQHLEFLEGFAKAVPAGANIRLVLAGEGPSGVLVQQRIADLGLNDRVIQLGYFSKPEQLIAIADVGVLASKREGLPRVVIQYLAGKCPVAVTNTDGIEEIVKDGVNGVIVRSVDAKTAAHAAVSLVQDEQRLQELKRGAAATDVSGWSLDSMFAGLDKAYGMLNVNNSMDTRTH